MGFRPAQRQDIPLADRVHHSGTGFWEVLSSQKHRIFALSFGALLVALILVLISAPISGGKIFAILASTSKQHVTHRPPRFS